MSADAASGVTQTREASEQSRVLPRYVTQLALFVSRAITLMFAVATRDGRFRRRSTLTKAPPWRMGASSRRAGAVNSFAERKTRRAATCSAYMRMLTCDSRRPRRDRLRFPHGLLNVALYCSARGQH
jgi:hypothetical protein